MAPFRLPADSELGFRFRSSPGRYTLMFLPADGGIPLRYDLPTSEQWQEVRVEVAEIAGRQGMELAAPIVAAGSGSGQFELILDAVQLHFTAQTNSP